MKKTVFAGSPQDIGRNYGRKFREKVSRNLKCLIRREGYEPLPLTDPAFKKWVSIQEKVIACHWPWLIEEMHGVAEGADFPYREILLLNLRAWQYTTYEPKLPSENCSSLAVPLQDGTIANAGALDDPYDYYCGLVGIIPEKGYSFLSFPITGTSWASRSINSSGLVIGISSQVFKNLESLPHFINQDIAVRVITQTCTKTGEVRDFCRNFPFNINLVVSDGGGNVFACHQTTAGFFEVSGQAPCALTNHLTDDRISFALEQKGLRECGLSGTTVFRRGKLLDFIKIHSGKCTAGQVRAFLAERANNLPSSTCPEGNYVLTYANSQTEPGKFWINESHGKSGWVPFDITDKTKCM